MENLTASQFSFLALKGFFLGFVMGFSMYVVSLVRRSVSATFTGHLVG